MPIKDEKTCSSTQQENNEQYDRMVGNLLLAQLHKIVFVNTLCASVDQQTETYRKWEKALKSLRISDFQSVT